MILSIRVSAVALRPFLTATSEEIFKQLNINDETYSFVDNNKYTVGTPIPLFLRIDKDEKLKELEKN